MDVLRLLAAALLAPVACYEPHLASCTVRCSSADDCAPGQQCSAQGLCAAPGRACPGPDGTPIDAPPLDARMDAPIDARPKVQLHVRVNDGGAVEVVGVETCDATGPDQGDCRFDVAPDMELELRAVPHSGFRFDRWTSEACSTAGMTCLLTPLAPIEVRARFVHE